MPSKHSARGTLAIARDMCRAQEQSDEPAAATTSPPSHAASLNAFKPLTPMTHVTESRLHHG
jgi:hypothetical protein